jgi:hypothetical protein
MRPCTKARPSKTQTFWKDLNSTSLQIRIERRVLVLCDCAHASNSGRGVETSLPQNVLNPFSNADLVRTPVAPTQPFLKCADLDAMLDGNITDENSDGVQTFCNFARPLCRFDRVQPECDGLVQRRCGDLDRVLVSVHVDDGHPARLQTHRLGVYHFRSFFAFWHLCSQGESCPYAGTCTRSPQCGWRLHRRHSIIRTGCFELK